jgi:hypothetical protein
MFIEQGVHSENKFWKYLIGSVIIIITSFIGQLPWLLGITYVTNIKGSHYPSSTDEMMHFDPNDFVFMLISFLFFYHGGALLAQSDNFRDYDQK